MREFWIGVGQAMEAAGIEPSTFYAGGGVEWWAFTLALDHDQARMMRDIEKILETF